LILIDPGIELAEKQVVILRDAPGKIAEKLALLGLRYEEAAEKFVQGFGISLAIYWRRKKS